MDNIPKLLETLNISDDKIKQIIKEFKDLNPNKMTITDIQKLSKLIGIQPKQLKKIVSHHLSNTPQLQKISSKIGRNIKCPCDSGKKYKKCCLGKTIGLIAQEEIKQSQQSQNQSPVKKIYDDFKDHDLCSCGSNIPFFSCCTEKLKLDKELDKELLELETQLSVQDKLCFCNSGIPFYSCCNIINDQCPCGSENLFYDCCGNTTKK